MITELRKSFSGKWIKLVLWIPILAMGLGSLLYYLPTMFKTPFGVSRAALTINGLEVGPEALQRQLSRETGRIAMLRQQFGPNADMFLKMYGLDDPRTMATQSLITETLLNQYATRMNIKIDPKLIMQRLQDPSFIIQQYPDMLAYGVFSQDGSLNSAALRQYALKTNQSMTDIEDAIEEGLRRALVIDAVSAAAYVGQNELRQAFIQDYLSKKFSILTFPLEKYSTAIKKEGVTQQELEEFFKTQNKQTKRYWVPEKRSGTYWLFSPEEYGLEVTDKQIQAYYEQHKHKKFVQTPAQVQVRKIVLKVPDETKRQEIVTKIQQLKDELKRDPTKFEALAKQHSDDKETAAKGGVVPFFSRGEKDPAFEQAAFRLRNDGDISEVLSTPEGLQILQRVSRKPIVFKPLDAVTKDIKTTVLNQLFKDTFSKDLERKIRTLKENPQKFYDLAQEKKAAKKELKNAERGFTPELEKLYKLKKSNWEFYFDGTKGVVITLSEVQKSFEPELSTVKARVEGDVIQEKARKRLQADLEKAQKEALTKSFAEVQKMFDGSIEQTDWLKKDDQKMTGELSKRGVPVSRMLMLDNPGAVITSSDSTTGFVVKLDQVEPFNEQLFTSKKNELMARLYNEKKQLNQRGFIASLLRNATIKTAENESNANLPVDDEML